MDDPSCTSSRQIEAGIALLKEGGVIAFPTDTVYGLGASSRIPAAVERIYSIKQRPLNQPLPLLVADMAQVEEITETVPVVARRLISTFMPGPLTIVLRRSQAVHPIITAGGPTVAVRIPAHPIPLALIRGLGAPVTGTSANLSGCSSPLTAAGVREQLGDSVDLVIDGGRAPGGTESTIIDISGEKPVMLRRGPLSLEALEKVAGQILIAPECK